MGWKTITAFPFELFGKKGMLGHMQVANAGATNTIHPLENGEQGIILQGYMSTITGTTTSFLVYDGDPNGIRYQLVVADGHASTNYIDIFSGNLGVANEEGGTRGWQPILMIPATILSSSGAVGSICNITFFKWKV